MRKSCRAESPLLQDFVRSHKNHFFWWISPDFLVSQEFNFVKELWSVFTFTTCCNQFPIFQFTFKLSYRVTSLSFEKSFTRPKAILFTQIGFLNFLIRLVTLHFHQMHSYKKSPPKTRKIWRKGDWVLLANVSSLFAPSRNLMFFEIFYWNSKLFSSKFLQT